MPDVFDAKTRIKLKVGDPGDDKSLPDGGALAYGSITGSSALSGTTGVDCMKVNGDRWQQMDGKLTENYTGDKQIQVLGKHTEQITGNRSIGVLSGNIERNVSAGKVSDTIAQNHEETVGMNYQLQAGMKCDIQAGVSYSLQSLQVQLTAGAMMDIEGAMVRINS